MKLPGFSAEGSLYTTGGRYGAAGAGQQIQAAVHPAQAGRAPASYYLENMRPLRFRRTGNNSVSHVQAKRFGDDGRVLKPTCNEWTNCHYEAGCDTCTTQFDNCKQETTTVCHVIVSR
jgi:hypothetical protein